MTEKITFRLVSGAVKKSACEQILSLPIPEQDPKTGKFRGKVWTVEIKPETRNLEQNAKLHALLSEISRKAEFNGQRLSVEQWKMIFVSGHTVATGGQASVCLGLENEIINLRESTAKMSKARLASLIEYITAWWCLVGKL